VLRFRAEEKTRTLLPSKSPRNAESVRATYM
jgi:hypothetical protein